MCRICLNRFSMTNIFNETWVNTMSETADLRLIEKICWYYYCDGMTQQNIAKLLGLSRLKVIKLLEEGRQKGIVSFYITRLDNNKLDLEKKLIEKYALENAYVVPEPENSKNITESLARAACSYVNLRLTNDSVINIGYGKTLSLAFNYLASESQCNWTAVSLTGGVNNYLPNARSDIFKAKMYLYPAPLLMNSKDLCDKLCEHPDLQWIKRMASTSSMTLFSAGGLDEHATVIEQGLFDRSDFIYLKRLGAVGDILGHFINKNGEIVDKDIDSRLISTSLDTLKDMPQTIMVAGGAEKLQIITAALAKGLCKVLITTEKTAENLM